MSSTIELTPEEVQVNKDFANGVLKMVALAKGFGIEPPSPATLVGQLLAAKPGYVLHPIELRFLYKLAEYNLADVVSAVPAENVPAEISGAWYEFRSIRPLMEQIDEFLYDPDDQDEDEEPEAEEFDADAPLPLDAMRAAGHDVDSCPFCQADGTDASAEDDPLAPLRALLNA